MSVPVTRNDLRKPARLPIAAMSSNVRNFSSAAPDLRSLMLSRPLVKPAEQSGVIVQHFANAAQSAAFVLLHELAALERILAPVVRTELQVVPHLRLVAFRVDPQVVEALFPESI